MSEAKAANGLMKRDDYKAIKRMDREQMTAYLKRVYMRGYEAGCKATAKTDAVDITTETDKSDLAPAT